MFSHPNYHTVLKKNKKLKTITSSLNFFIQTKTIKRNFPVFKGGKKYNILRNMSVPEAPYSASHSNIFRPDQCRFMWVGLIT